MNILYAQGKLFSCSSVTLMHYVRVASSLVIFSLINKIKNFKVGNSAKIADNNLIVNI